jgi:hypothetical protein
LSPPIVSGVDMRITWSAMDQWRGGHPVEMYVFTELDNLEYSLKRYKLGYVDQNLVIRELTAFRSRCLHSRLFTNLAHASVGLGLQPASLAGPPRRQAWYDALLPGRTSSSLGSADHHEGAGYDPVTRRVVYEICYVADRE